VAEALSGVTFKTEGTVKLDPDAKLALAGRPELPTPTPAQLGAGATPDSKAAVLTNFTSSRTCRLGRGRS
jgi:hypothetical protein